METLKFLADLVDLAKAAWAIGGGVVLIGTLLFGWRYKQRIAALEKRLESGSPPTVHFHGNYHIGSVNIDSDGLHRATVKGDGEIVLSEPFEIILEESEERIEVSESLENKLIKGED